VDAYAYDLDLMVEVVFDYPKQLDYFVQHFYWMMRMRMLKHLLDIDIVALKLLDDELVSHFEGENYSSFVNETNFISLYLQQKKIKTIYIN
jgi:hypothetical protein